MEIFELARQLGEAIKEDENNYDIYIEIYNTLKEYFITILI